MVKNGDNTNRLIDETIAESIDFERLMDQTDFESWRENDDPSVLKACFKQEPSAFCEFEKNKKELRRICCQMIKKGNSEPPRSEDKLSLEKYIVCQLFKSKSERFEARIDFGKGHYKKARHYLLSVLNVLQNLKGNIIDKRWTILLCNDLSICYAGLDNSYMSMGYAEEAKRIMKKEYRGFCKQFNQKVSVDDSTDAPNVIDDKFLSDRLDVLYTITLYNLALAEKRSHSYNYAERDLGKIIKYAQTDTSLLDFNYYSSLLNLAALYIDLGRGNEAIELLDKVIDKNKLHQNNILYWNIYLSKINALIDQSEYPEAEKLFRKLIEIPEAKGSLAALYEENRVTITGFKALSYYARYRIEKVTNNLKTTDKERIKKENDELKEIEKMIENNIELMRAREQKGLEIKAYKQLSDIYTIYSENKDVTNDATNYDKYIMKYLVRFISQEGQFDDLDAFIEDKETMDVWMDKCDDLGVLESFTDQVIKFVKNQSKSVERYMGLLDKLRERIKEECEDKDQLSRAEKIIRNINEVQKKEKYYDKFHNSLKKAKILDECPYDEKGLSKKDIWKRLDINEKDFDKALFKRSKKLKKDDHMVEVIILKRWNSFSPGLFKESTGSLGGGYLIRVKRNSHKINIDHPIHNIAMDPGYNFLQNFRMEGFCIDDIDTIIVTHSHLDHCAELLPAMDLIYQSNKRYKDTTNKGKPRKKVNLCLSRGAYSKFLTYIDDQDWKKQLKDVIVLDNLENRNWKPFEGLKISAIPTPHIDLGGVKAMGLKIEIGVEQEKILCLGFTGDTPWYPRITEDFKGCDLLCVHLGSIRYQEIGFTDRRHEEDSERRIASKNVEREKLRIYGESNHLLFLGAKYFINDCIKKGQDTMIIVGEFGEELKYGLRRDLCKKLSEGIETKCLPADIGLYIGIDKKGTRKIRCNFCGEFVEEKEISTFSYGREDAIHYICKTCERTLSETQKQATIEHNLTRH